MISFIKKFISLSLALLLIIAFASCNKQQEGRNETTAAQTTLTTTKSTTTQATTKSTTSPKNPADDTPTTLRIATFNIKSGELVGYDFDILAQDILNSGAEIVAFQEVDMNTSRNGNKNTMEELSKATGYEYYEFVKARNFGGGGFGNAILSKYPITSVGSVLLPKTTSGEEQRVLLHVEIQVADNEYLDFFTTHIQQCSRIEQFTRINNQLKTFDRFVLMGDFNWYPSEPFDIFENSYLISTKEDPLITTTDNYKFDNIVISNNISSSNTQVIDTEHSDHYMLLTDITLP